MCVAHAIVSKSRELLHMLRCIRLIVCVLLTNWFRTCLFVTISCAISWLLHVWYSWINKNIMIWFFVRLSSSHFLFRHLRPLSMCILSITYAKMFHSFQCTTHRQCHWQCEYNYFNLYFHVNLLISSSRLASTVVVAIVSGIGSSSVHSQNEGILRLWRCIAIFFRRFRINPMRFIKWEEIMVLFFLCWNKQQNANASKCILSKTHWADIIIHASR